jgi:hypothetical protein
VGSLSQSSSNVGLSLIAKIDDGLGVDLGTELRNSSNEIDSSILVTKLRISPCQSALRKAAPRP